MESHDDIKIIVVEDEAIWMQSIVMNLNEFGFTVVGKATSFDEAMPLLASTPFDIALLDINLQKRNSGIEIGKIISMMYNKPFIFITSSFDKESIDAAIVARPSAYLAKPVVPASLFVAIQNAINNFHETAGSEPPKEQITNAPFFFVKNGTRYKKIFWKDVVYLRSEKNYTSIFNSVDQTEYMVRSTLAKTMQFIIPAELQSGFLQINRSEALQQSYIQEFSGETVRTMFRSFSVTDGFIKNLKNNFTVIS